MPRIRSSCASTNLMRRAMPSRRATLIEGVGGGHGDLGRCQGAGPQHAGHPVERSDVLNIPLLATDPYGNFIPRRCGFAQIVISSVGRPADSGRRHSPSPGNACRVPCTGHAFLDDIAHTPIRHRPRSLIADSDSDVGTEPERRRGRPTTTNCSTRISSPATAAATRTSA